MKDFFKQFKELTLKSVRLLIKYPWMGFLAMYALISSDRKLFYRELDKIEAGYYKR